MALLVFVLATMPCCVEDNCICCDMAELYGVCACDNDNGDGCDGDMECCSPFVSCNTCTGVTTPVEFRVPQAVSFRLSDKPVSNCRDKAITGFDGSIWQPPKFC